MYRNTASQKITLRVITAATGLPAIGDTANLNFYLSIDDALPAELGNAIAQVNQTNAPGDYSCTLTQAETNGVKLRFSGKSSTAGVIVIPETIYTVPSNALADVAQLAFFNVASPIGTVNNLARTTSGVRFLQKDVANQRVIIGGGPGGAGSYAVTPRSISKNGGAFAFGSGGDEVGDNVHVYYTLTQAQVNTVGPLLITGGYSGYETTVECYVGTVDANISAVLGTSLTEGATGRLAGGLQTFFDVATPTGTVNSLPAAVPGAANGLHILGDNFGDTVYTGVSESGMMYKGAPGNRSGLVCVGTGSGTGLQVQTSYGFALHVVGSTLFDTLTLTGPVTATNASNDIRINGKVPGAADGLLIAGNNAGTTTLGALAVTGNLSVGNTFSTNGLSVATTTTFTGAVLASSSSNDIRGITPKDGAITDASFTLPDENATVGAPTGFLGKMLRTFRSLFGPKNYRDRTTGKITVRNDADTVTLQEFKHSTTGSVDTIERTV